MYKMDVLRHREALAYNKALSYNTGAPGSVIIKLPKCLNAKL